ncbi:MAG: nucleotide exchange factor GrpE [Bacteroidales bacterium]|nr:nucleotide exchange factor GrpE [Bacteroidales bacterium]
MKENKDIVEEENILENGHSAEEQKTEEKAPEEKETKKTKAEKKEERKIEALKDEIEDLKEQIATLEGKVEAERNDYVRLMAEFETFRRRTAEEKLELKNTAATDTIKGLLPVLDDCERAMEMLKDSADEAAKEGTSLIYNKLMAYLQTKGLSPIVSTGEPFDTDFHEAVAQIPVPEEDKKGKVFDTVETGYTLNGKVIRYSKVVVGN